MSDEEKISSVNQAVEEAIRLIREKHPGSNLDEARKYLSLAGEALKQDKFEDAIELATKAQLSARPTTEYLLSKAKELAVDAEKSFKSGNFKKPISSLKQRALMKQRISMKKDWKLSKRRLSLQKSEDLQAIK